jgi:hypothetical protein
MTQTMCLSKEILPEKLETSSGTKNSPIGPLLVKTIDKCLQSCPIHETLICLWNDSCTKLERKVIYMQERLPQVY